MRKSAPLLRRAFLPLIVFAAVLALHFTYHGLFAEPACDPATEAGPSGECAPVSVSWWGRYVDGQHYWMGASYAMAFAFAAWALRHYREQRQRAARAAVIGGLSFGGILAVAGCFLTGCCGSLMLPIYLSLLGPWFLPWAKPLSPILATLSILLGIWWVRRKTAQVTCADPRCACNRSGTLRSEP